MDSVPTVFLTGQVRTDLMGTDGFQEADITGPLAQGGALRGRLVVSNASKDYFYKYAHDERQSVFGVLDYDLTLQSQ